MVDEKETLTDMRRKDNEREEKIKEELSCQFVRINSDKKDYDEYFQFGKICNHIIESNKKSTEESIKQSLLDKI